VADGECRRDSYGPDDSKLDERVYRHSYQHILEEDDYRNVYEIDSK